MSEAHDPMIRIPESPSSSRIEPNEAGDFECNICFELAQDPIITLCGHLYCWPCLYRWLRAHSLSHECPVCKALIQEQKLIPLYGRGNALTDPRSKPVEIPDRPAGQRPETAPSPAPAPEDLNFSPLLGLWGGFVPIATLNFSNFGMSADFGGAFLPFMGVQFHGFPNPQHGYVRGSGFDPVRDPEGELNSGSSRRDATPDDENLKKILFLVIFFVLVAFITM